jgi:hypothetical protein
MIFRTASVNLALRGKLQLPRLKGQDIHADALHTRHLVLRNANVFTDSVSVPVRP